MTTTTECVRRMVASSAAVRGNILMLVQHAYSQGLSDGGHAALDGDEVVEEREESVERFMQSVRDALGN